MSNFIIYVYIFGGSLLLHLPNVFSIDSGKCANEFGTCKAIFLHQNEINENFSTLIENNSNGNVNNGTKFQIEIDSTNQYENVLLQTLGSEVMRVIPPFDVSRSAKCSSQCKLHTKKFIRSLKKFELWAFQMHDASAKIPSGILNGNLNQLGDFDQCVNSASPDGKFTGKYCLAYIQIKVPQQYPRLTAIRKLVQSHDAFVNDFDDPGHRVPRFSILNWALCVPSSCTNLDVENALNEYITNFANSTGINYELRVEDKMCQVKQPVLFDRNTKIAILFFALILFNVLVSTVIDLICHDPHELLVAFSLWKNGKSLISLERPASDIGTIHGIRLINAILLLVSHKSMAVFFNPHVNRTGMIEALGDYISVIGRAASIYTDVFLLISGLLTSYTIIGRLQRKQSPRIFQEYIGRLMRIVPTFGALIVFCTYILPLLGSGPQWNLVVNTHAEICKENWWRNMLFIHNYFGFSKMCLTHTHHLGIDTELFAVAPILILILWKWPKNGSIFLLFLATVSTAMRFYITVAEDLSNYVYFGASIKQLFRTADLMYALPAHRATIYIIGILVGYVMRTYRNVKMTRTQIFYGWAISIAMFLSTLLGPAKMGNMNYEYNSYDAAYYAALGPMAWCGVFVWIIYTTHIGYKTFISEVLSWPIFSITTRLSFAVYLTQFPIFFYNVGTTRHSGYYHFITTTVNIYEYLCVIIASIVLTLLFDTPFQNIKKYLFRTKPSIPKIEPTEPKRIE